MVKIASTKPSPTKTLEQTFWDAAAKMRANLESGEYKHIIVGLVYLKYVSDTFPASRQWVKPERLIKNCGIQVERQ